MLEKVFLIKYILGELLNDDELKDIAVIGLIVHVLARVASNNIVGNFELWWAFSNIADLAFFAVPIALMVRVMFAWININNIFTKEELEEIEEVL